MRNKIVLAALIVAGLLIAACASPAPEPPVASLGVERAPSAELAKAGRASPELATSPAGNQMIIRRANLELIVKDTEKAMAEISRIVAELQGYVADSNVFRVNEQLQATLTVRVPAKDMDKAMSQFKALAVRVEREMTGTENVTEEYTDLEARLKNLELTEKELQELLSEVRQKTGKAEDVLAVYNRLTEIRGEIERIKGRMRYLSNLVDLATVTVTLIPDVLARPVVKPGWRPLETLRNAVAALITVLQALVDLLIYVLVFATLLIPLVLAIVLIRVWQRRRQRARAR